MFRVFLGLGSNIGDRVQYLSDAVTKIGSIAKPMIMSSIYETEPVGMNDSNSFYNLAIEISTDKLPATLIQNLKDIEMTLGRTPSTHMKPREIDIDILLYSGFIYRDNNVEVPHPEMTHRRFVLEPLDEIAPQLVHPVLHQTIETLFARCPDTHTITRTNILLTHNRTMEIA